MTVRRPSLIIRHGHKRSQSGMPTCRGPDGASWHVAGQHTNGGPVDQREAPRPDREGSANRNRDRRYGDAQRPAPARLAGDMARTVAVIIHFPLIFRAALDFHDKPIVPPRNVTGNAVTSVTHKPAARPTVASGQLT